MNRFRFDCIDAWANQYAVVPGLTLRLRITETTGQPIEAIALRCQLRIEPQRRRYSAAEAQRLTDLFGHSDRWADTLKPLSFTTLSIMVPGFSKSTVVDVDVPCSYDLEIASTKFFNALEDGAIPLLLLFSGTVFGSDQGRLQVQQVPWSNEASYALPVSVWRETIDLHFPNSAWLRVRQDTMDSLQRFRSQHAFASWDATFTAMLASHRTKDT
ncbi:DUF6084 family protein [Allokutzneria albata]|uniref:Uncharacterized protein n=1 Tax=Allokutzneria albata TaxID=211114 RepID=A0A1G9WD46_ALLAB|nr:DUF6084 family protein [Allokutzneria albata]SDM81935.1 hypothetical protein SAMN04489726_3514 [Allokutzneria albata]